MNIYFYFIVIILLACLIVGLKTKSNQLSSDIQTDRIEKFSTSSTGDVKTGASTFYDWGLRGSTNPNVNDYQEEEEPSPCPPKPSPPKPQPRCRNCNKGNTYVENDYYIYPKHRPSPCDKCDINRHPDINKYVLKSSVPPCPDMSKYALKSMVKNCPDMRNYIKKSEVPPCPPKIDLSNYIRKSEVPSCPATPDMSQYVLKSTIPATPTCPKCPVCPLCPICPPSYKNIENDPRFKDWLIKYKAEQSKILHREFISRDTCERDVQVEYTKGLKSGKDSAYRDLSKELGTDLKNILEDEKCNPTQDYRRLINKYDAMKKENEKLQKEIDKRRRQAQIILREEEAAQANNPRRGGNLGPGGTQPGRSSGKGGEKGNNSKSCATPYCGGSNGYFYLGNNGAYSANPVKNCN